MIINELNDDEGGNSQGMDSQTTQENTPIEKLGWVHYITNKANSMKITSIYPSIETKGIAVMIQVDDVFSPSVVLTYVLTEVELRLIARYLANPDKPEAIVWNCPASPTRVCEYNGNNCKHCGAPK